MEWTNEKAVGETRVDKDETRVGETRVDETRVDETRMIPCGSTCLFLNELVSAVYKTGYAR